MKDFLDKLRAHARAPEDGTGSDAGAGDAGAGDAGAGAGGDNAGAGDPPANGGGGKTALTLADAFAAGDKSGEADDGDKAGEYVDDPSLSADENAAKRAEHEKAAKGDDDAGDKKDDDSGDPIDPASYDYGEVPEGFVLDPAIDKEFRELAAERKWSQDDVKALTGMQAKLYEKQMSAHAETVKEWGDSLATNKEIGGSNLDKNLGMARAAISEFFPEGARDMLDRTGLGNHPDMVVGFVRLGAAMGEMKSLIGDGKGQKTTILDGLYGSE